MYSSSRRAGSKGTCGQGHFAGAMQVDQRAPLLHTPFADEQAQGLSVPSTAGIIVPCEAEFGVVSPASFTPDSAFLSKDVFKNRVEAFLCSSVQSPVVDANATQDAWGELCQTLSSSVKSRADLSESARLGTNKPFCRLKYWTAYRSLIRRVSSTHCRRAKRKVVALYPAR